MCREHTSCHIAFEVGTKYQMIEKLVNCKNEKDAWLIVLILHYSDRGLKFFSPSRI